MDKTLTTTFMIVVSMITAVMVFNAVLPAVARSRDAMVSVRSRLDERIKTKITVIHAVGELDQNSLWQDTNGNGDFDVFVWVKNIGAVRIPAIEGIDVFFGAEGNFVRIPFKADAGGSYPYWEWALENDTDWNPTATLKLNIRFAATLNSERYFIKIVLPNGVSANYFLSM